MRRGQRAMRLMTTRKFQKRKARERKKLENMG
jgi:hypothetical protein